MKFIKMLEFRKLPTKVQQIFINYFLENKSTTDLVQVELHPKSEIRLYSYNLQESKLQFEDKKEYEFKGRNIIGRYEISPLFVESQLRKFIEDKTGKRFTELEIFYDTGYDIKLVGGFESKDIEFTNLGHDLLKAYWKVAVQIAEQISLGVPIKDITNNENKES